MVFVRWRAIRYVFPVENCDVAIAQPLGHFLGPDVEIGIVELRHIICSVPITTPRHEKIKAKAEGLPYKHDESYALPDRRQNRVA
jgi:hypothetical protein